MQSSCRQKITKHGEDLLCLQPISKYNISWNEIQNIRMFTKQQERNWLQVPL